MDDAEGVRFCHGLPGPMRPGLIAGGEVAGLTEREFGSGAVEARGGSGREP